MSEEKEGIVVEYAYAVKVNNVTNETTFSLDISTDDTAEMLAAANLKMSEDVALAKFKSPAAVKHRLSGNRDALTAVIEFARSKALDPDDLHSVWAALVEIANSPNRPAPLLGMTDDGSAVKYRAANKTELFTFRMLKGRLERRESGLKKEALKSP